MLCNILSTIMCQSMKHSRRMLCEVLHGMLLLLEVPVSLAQLGSSNERIVLGSIRHFGGSISGVVFKAQKGGTSF